jgi:hypothetical protein
MRTRIFLTLAAGALFVATQAHAQKIQNSIAVFAALDKVTARISPLEVPVDQSMKFGALTITPRACYTAPPTEEPQTSVFVEIEETQLDETDKRIFTGWMFAESPGLHGVEHPVFDVWLTSCKTSEPAKADADTVDPKTGEITSA